MERHIGKGVHIRNGCGGFRFNAIHAKLKKAKKINL